ncbi:MAG TPA: hypothetical protein VD768_08805 [Sphingomicrobium sp.]|nr:hypothetical protein [Sphingomicrobium sp.]
MGSAEEIAEKLTEAEREAFLSLPLPRDADPARRIAARTYGSIWRKSTKHWRAMLGLEREGLVERKISRGETLWRPTRPLGLAVRAHLLAEDRDDG